MATAGTANNLCPWPNSQNDYELRDVIGKFFMKLYNFIIFCSFLCFVNIQKTAFKVTANVGSVCQIPYDPRNVNDFLRLSGHIYENILMTHS